MATRRHGQNGRLYVDISSGGAGSAVLVSTIADSKRSFATDTVEVTAYEDTNKVYVAGKPDASATYTGFLDIAQDQLWYPAQTGSARKFYDYIDVTNDPNKYWFGTGIFDFAVEQSTTTGIAVTTNMKPASLVSRSWA